MHIQSLHFGFGRRVPVILQTEAAECGLACLAMVAGFYGHNTNLSSLRQKFSISIKGVNFKHLIGFANALKLTPRALKLDLNSLPQLRLPAVIHWDFNHFVVLVKAGSNKIVIHDPAIGPKVISLVEFSRHFTGVAMELSPAADFVPTEERSSISFGKLLGKMPGLGCAATESLLLAAVLEVTAIASPLFLQLAVDNAIVSNDRDLVKVLGFGFLLVAMLQVGVTALRSWALIYLGTQVNLQLVSNLFSTLLRLPISFFEKRHLGDIVSRFESINTIQRTLTGSFLEAILDGTMAIVTLAMMFYYNSRLSFVVLSAFLLYAALRFILYTPIRQASEEQIVCSAKQQSHFLETIRGVQSIKLFNREQSRRAAWQNLAIDNFNAGIRTQRLSIVYQGFNGTLFGIENIIVIWVGALTVLDGGFSIGMLYAFVSYKLQFIARGNSLIDKCIEFRMLSLHRDRVSDIALAKPEYKHATSMISTEALTPQIELIGISFSYSDTDPPIFNNLSLTIDAGESIAIVGPSGCGKTTLLKLMLGLLEPTKGEVRIGGVPIKQIGHYDYRELIGAVMQEDQLFSGTIADNISFFDSEIDMRRVQESATLASIHPDIMSMPMQYQTLVGDMGTSLSGGQKQRLFLARALYRQPKIIFLDEATSHLDSAREKSVNEAIKKLQLTRVIIAHREETIKMANRVIHLGNTDIGDAEPRSESVIRA
jgi:ATP-binding cassette subfamily B protein RaxB